MSDEPRYITFLRESNAIEGVFDETSMFNAEVAWKYLIAKKKVGVATILKAHAMLMANSDLLGEEKGAVRTIPVYIGGEQAMRPEFVPLRLKAWARDANVRCLDFDEAKRLHVEFEGIHPFVDGNGRIGRMLMNWHVVHHLGQLPMVIKADERQDYYKWFRD